MLDSQGIGQLTTGDDHIPSRAPENAIPYCIDCFNAFGSKRPLPDGWWGEKRRVQIDGLWHALCHAHYDKREKEKILRSSQPRLNKD